METGEALAWVIITGTAALILWALVSRFRNPFVRLDKGFERTFYTQVHRLVTEFHGTDDRPTKRIIMNRLADLAQDQAGGMINRRKAYVVIARWLQQYEDSRQNGTI